MARKLKQMEEEAEKAAKEAAARRRVADAANAAEAEQAIAAWQAAHIKASDAQKKNNVASYSQVPYLLMLLVLLVRPYGIFGTEEIRRV